MHNNVGQLRRSQTERLSQSRKGTKKNLRTLGDLIILGGEKYFCSTRWEQGVEELREVRGRDRTKRGNSFL
jgi:hypothetical protein